MARHPQEQMLEQDAIEYEDDLNPNYEQGENQGREDDTISAYDLKELHRQLDLEDDELKLIPVLAEGTQLKQGAVYLDLHHPENGEFKPTGDMLAGPGQWIVPKKQVDHELWNRLLGIRDPNRLGEFAAQERAAAGQEIVQPK
jgi:hypothetical protein